MAQRVQVILEDDIDGSEAQETISFSIDGSTLEIDLSNEHATALRSTLDRYIERARKAPSPKRQTRTVSNRAKSSAVRAWAREHGTAVNDRGRIPASVTKEYRAATS